MRNKMKFNELWPRTSIALLVQLKPFYLLIQVRKPKCWIADIILCTSWVGSSHSPAGGIHVCGGYSSVLSPLLHSLLNVSIVTDRYNFQSISCNIQIGRCKNLLILSLSLSLLFLLSLWMNYTSCYYIFVLLTLFFHIRCLSLYLNKVCE